VGIHQIPRLIVRDDADLQTLLAIRMCQSRDGRRFARPEKAADEKETH
jgi:hypothetical protein